MNELFGRTRFEIELIGLTKNDIANRKSEKISNCIPADYYYKSPKNIFQIKRNMESYIRYVREMGNKNIK